MRNHLDSLSGVMQQLHMNGSQKRCMVSIRLFFMTVSALIVPIRTMDNTYVVYCSNKAAHALLR